MKKRNVIIILISILVLVGGTVCLLQINKKQESVLPSSGDNSYNLNCEKITILVDDKVVVELIGKEKEKLLEYFNNNAISDEYDVETKIDETYNITVDFNNNITKLHMRKDDNYVYYSSFTDPSFTNTNEWEFRYELKKEVHDEIIKIIEENL